MAQHYPIFEQDEPKVFEKIRKIVKDILETINWTMVADFGVMKDGHKTITKLPKEYNPNGRAVTIGEFNLENKEWGEHRTKATLEVHFTIYGEIQKVYYPL